MSITFGAVVKKSGTYALSFIASRALSFLLIPLYTRYLTTTDYGVLELLDLTLNFVIVFAGSRLGQALFYYYFSETDEEIRRKHISTSIFGSFVLGAILCAAASLSAGLLSQIVFGNRLYTGYFHLVAITMGTTIPLETFLCAVRAFNEPKFYTKISVTRLSIAGVVNVILLTGWHLGVWSMLWSAIISQVCILIALAWYVFRRVPWGFSMDLLRKQAGYSIPLSVGSVGEFILNYGDRYFLRQSVSLSEIGLYSLAYKIGMMVPTVQYPFALYWSSQQVKIVSGQDGERIFARVCTYLTLGLTFVAVLITLFIHPILNKMVGVDFRPAAKYVPLLTLAYLIRAVGGHFREVFVIKKRPVKEAQALWAGSIICLAGYAVLIPRMGVWGAVYATLISFTIVGIFAFVTSLKLWRVHYEYGRLAKVAMASVVVIGTLLAIDPQNFWMQCLVGILLAAAFIVLLQLQNFWHADEKEYLLRLWNRGQQLLRRKEAAPAVQ